jgi:hypothetical protein
MNIYSQAYYNEMYNVTKYMPTYLELLQEVREKKTKSSRSRMLNKYFKDAEDVFQDLQEAVTHRGGMLHGAVHTNRDIKKYVKHISDLENLIMLNKEGKLG